jgi:hypothetical protein
MENMVIVPKSEREMKEMMRKLGKYVSEEKAGSECGADENDGVQAREKRRE